MSSPQANWSPIIMDSESKCYHSIWYQLSFQVGWPGTRLLPTSAGHQLPCCMNRKDAAVISSIDWPKDTATVPWSDLTCRVSSLHCQSPFRTSPPIFGLSLTFATCCILHWLTFCVYDSRPDEICLIGHQDDGNVPSFFLPDLVQSVCGRLERLAVLDRVHDDVGVDLLGRDKMVHLQRKRNCLSTHGEGLGERLRNVFGSSSVFEWHALKGKISRKFGFFLDASTILFGFTGYTCLLTCLSYLVVCLL